MKKMTKKKANIFVWTIVILVSLVFIALKVSLKYYMNIDIPSVLLVIPLVWFLSFSLNLFSRNEKIKEMEKLLNDLGEITKNTATLAQDIAQKITAKGNDIAGLAQDPAMQNFVKETAPLVAKKTFANEARKKEIDAEIATIAAKPEYKPIMDKKAQYAAELEKLQKDAAVLSNGIGTQVAYTGKAIPWLIKEYIAVSKL